MTMDAEQDGRRTGSADTPTAQRLLDIVRDLVLELQPHKRSTLSVTLDSDIDRDLGLDSLGRAELLLRLDRDFKIRLPEQLIGDAQTPRALLEAVLEAAPSSGADAAGATAEPVLLPETAAPVQATTLLDVLATHVEAHGERPHIWLWRSDTDEECITYAALDRAARRVAQGLLDKGVEVGERVAIMLPTDVTFFHAFFGILMAGGVPVPVYPPFSRAQVEEHLRRQAGILQNAGAVLLVTDEEIKRVGVFLQGLTDTLRGCVTVNDLAAGPALDTPVPCSGDRKALIQYTSGSTGDPKGVVLTHDNLLANIRAMGAAMEADSTDVLVSWLPLYHDMGLIGAWLGCLYFGAPAVIMQPLSFLADPARWLWAMHRHRATLSAAPNFAYELCLKNIRDADIEGLDLSSLRMVLNGAEPVSPGTITRFSERFAEYGFRPGALAPVYGLAECSVGLAFPPPGRIPIIDRVDRESLSVHGKAVPAAPDDDRALEFVACGRPIPGHQIRIVDETGHEVPERRDGRLQFRGPSLTSGYFRNEEKTQELLSGDWAESGDRAYIAGGDIFLTGRIKDIIIRAGRNIYPHELEERVGAIDGVRKGCVAAFASPDPRTGTERLIVLAETRLKEEDQRDALRTAIAQASSDLLDLPPDDIVLAPPHAIPKTSSGKIRRSQARTLYDEGLIGQRASALWWQLTRLAFAATAQRIRRALRTGANFLYGAYWWTALLLVSLILWPLVVLAPSRNWAHAATHRGVRAFFRLVGIGFEVEGADKVPVNAAVLVCNHSSYLDGAAVCAAIPGPLSFVAKVELSRQFIPAAFLRRLGTIFVRRTDVAGSLDDADQTLQRAKAGERIVSFPEGTLSRMPGLLDFHLGAFKVAMQSDVPVIPVTILGARAVLRGDQWFPRRSAIRIHIGEPLSADGDGFEAAVRLRNAARAEILERVGEPDLAHERIDLTGMA